MDYTTQDQMPQDDAMMQLELQRRMKFADALRNQAAPEGQMVSGHYVAPAWTQQLANLAGKYVAGQQEQNAMQQYGDYEKAKSNKITKLVNELQQGKQVESPVSYQDAGGMPGVTQTTTQPYNQREYMAKVLGVMPQLAPKMLETSLEQQFKENAPIISHAGDIGRDRSGNIIFQNPEKEDKTTFSPLGKLTFELQKIQSANPNDPRIPQYQDAIKKETNLNTQAPVTRNMRQGMNEVTQQWNPDTKTWATIGQGPAFKPETGSQPPSGYGFVKDTNGKNKLDANGNPILTYQTGGPADPQLKEHAPLGNRESVFINRIGIASNETAKDLENIVKLPLTSDRGVFGGRKQGGTLFAAAKEDLANKMTSQDVQSYNTLASGLQRNLAAIEAAGLAPGGSLTHQMDAVIFKDGDTNFTKLQKLAQIKQIANAGLETTMSNPRLPQQQIDHFQTILDRINKSVPYDISDTIALQQAHEIDPNVTINDIMKSKKVSQSETSQANLSNPKNLPLTNKKGWGLHYDAKGNAAYVGPKGEIDEVK
jgi:hypothetical protein